MQRRSHNEAYKMMHGVLVLMHRYVSLGLRDTGAVFGDDLAHDWLQQVVKYEACSMQ